MMLETKPQDGLLLIIEEQDNDNKCHRRGCFLLSIVHDMEMLLVVFIPVLLYEEVWIHLS